MHLRKMFLLCLFFLNAVILAQIDPGSFPKIGYGDLYIQMLNHYPEWGTVDYTSRHFYYPELNAAGINYTLSRGSVLGYAPSVSMIGNIKILDDDFKSAANLTAFQVARATGNSLGFYSYEAGGTGPADITDKEQKFGFGTATLYSFWLQNRESTVGIADEPDIDVNQIRTFCAKVAEHDAGYILRGLFSDYHHSIVRALGYGIKLGIRCRINQIASGSPDDIVAIIKISQTKAEGSEPLSRKVDTGEPGSDVSLPAVWPDMYVRAGEFVGNSYVNILRSFDKYGYSNVHIDIYWNKTRDMYIDKIWTYNEPYNKLFVADAATQTSFRNDIKNCLIYNFNSLKTNPNWAHPYFDEAYPHSARPLGELNTLGKEVLGAEKYITGVNNLGYFDQVRYSNSIFRPPYINYDDYPLFPLTDTASVLPSAGKYSLQVSFDRLVQYNYGINPTDGPAKNGLRNSISLAQNETPDDLSDDVPFHFCMQICKQQEITNGVVVKVHNRAPTRNEILAQGWLGMCYGAKGLMYYGIWTLTPNATNPEKIWSVYGLFDSDGILDADIQDPKEEQVPNYRYYAVKELNTQIDKVSSSLLQLHWKNAFSLHKDVMQCSYISSVVSKYYDENWITDPQGQNFVELGLFKHKDAVDDENLDYFMLVNRRCLSTEERTVTVTINKAASPFTNWKVTDIATGYVFTLQRTGEFTITLAPGTGKLFRLEPVMIAGGTLAYDENIPSQAGFTVKGCVSIPAGKKVIINAGCNILFGPDAFLSVEGALKSYGLEGQTSILDFQNAPNHAGIYIKAGSTVELYNTTVTGAKTAIYCTSVPRLLKIDSCNFTNNTNALQLFNFGDSVYIGHSTFTNNQSALLASIGTSFVFAGNKLIGNYSPVAVFTTPNARIVNNYISGTGTSGLNGVYLQSSGGFLYDNIITGYKTGLYCYSSSPEIGACILQNNSYYGLYADGGSMPNLTAALLPVLEQEMQFASPQSPANRYVSLTGYNIFTNNGSVNRVTPHDPLDDGSEIKLNSSLINFGDSVSCTNSVVDDRDGDNTALLVSSRNYLQAIIDGRGIYWGGRGFNENRKGNIYRILTDPSQYTVPRAPSDEANKVFVTDSIFGVIDTLYAVAFDGSAIPQEETRRLEGIIRLFVNQPGGSENYFNAALAAETDSVERFAILSKMYMFECMNGSDPGEFDRIRNLYLQYTGTLTDTTLMKAMSNLSALCLLRSEQYETAISKFTDIIVANPGSDEAAYAEIDLLMAQYLAELNNAVLPKSSAAYSTADIGSKVLALVNKVSKFGEDAATAKPPLPKEYFISQNFPNPFNPSTTIRFSLPKAGLVTLKIYDILGNEVASLLNEQMGEGYHTATFNAKNLASGVYVYRITCNDFISAKKMTVIK